MCGFPWVTPFTSTSLVLLLGWDKVKVNTQGKNCISHQRWEVILCVICWMWIKEITLNPKVKECVFRPTEDIWQKSRSLLINLIPGIDGSSQ